MSAGFIAQKGAAEPAAHHPGDAARFHARRTILLPPINLHATGDSPTRDRNAQPGAKTSSPRRAASLTGARARRKFTFRIDDDRHAAFCRAAETRAVSRQQLLTLALDEFLARQVNGGSAGPLLPTNAAARPSAF